MATSMGEVTARGDKLENVDHLTRGEIPLRWVFLLTALVTFTSMALAAYAVLRSTPLASQGYRLTVAMMCFSLSTLAGLLFASKAELRASLGLLSATIAGQAALWLISLSVFTWVFPEKLVMEPAALQRLVEVASSGSGRWESFEDWKAHLGSFRHVFEREEESNTKHLLNAAFIRGEGILKPVHTTVETLFVFPPTTATTRHVVKFQRIAGKSPDAKGASVYLTASPTTVAGTASSYFFVRRGTRIQETHPLTRAGEGLWQRLDRDVIEGMLVAVYTDSPDLEGDWLQVHTPKYTSKDDGGTTRIGVAAVAPIEAGSGALWEMRWAMLAPANSLPLLFHQRTDERRFDLGNWSPEFQGWLSTLEAVLAPAPGSGDAVPKEAKAFLAEVRDRLALAPRFTRWQDVMKGPVYGNRLSFAATDVCNPVIVTFLWADDAPVTVSTLAAPLRPRPAKP